MRTLLDLLETSGPIERKLRSTHWRDPAVYASLSSADEPTLDLDFRACGSPRKECVFGCVLSKGL